MAVPLVRRYGIKVVIAVAAWPVLPPPTAECTRGWFTLRASANHLLVELTFCREQDR